MTHPSVDGDKLNFPRGSSSTVQKYAPRKIYSLKQGGLKTARHAPGVLEAPEVKSKSNKSNPMSKLIGSQEDHSIDQIFSPQPAILYIIIPFLSDSLYSPAFCFLMANDPVRIPPYEKKIKRAEELRMMLSQWRWGPMKRVTRAT